MTAHTVLVTGSSGFVGTAAIRALAADNAACSLRLLVHETVPAVPTDDRVEHVRADLADPNSLGKVCEGIDTVLHLATHVSDDAERCQAVNTNGTEALVAVARLAGVKRLIYLSNAAVYGYAVHRGAREDDAAVKPATPISRSRVRAEKAIIDAGGIVLRPLFVYGNGDTKFIPAVVRGLSRMPFLVNRGDARLSVVPVDDLASTLAALARADWDSKAAGPYHITDGNPISFRALALTLRDTIGISVPRWSLPYPFARVMLRVVGGEALGARRSSESTAHRLFLVTHDHFYDDARLSTLLGVRPSSRFETRLGEYAGWYRRFLNLSRSEVGS